MRRADIQPSLTFANCQSVLAASEVEAPELVALNVDPPATDPDASMRLYERSDV